MIARSAVAVACSLSLAATPALAQDRYRHRDDGIDAGDVFAGLVIVGAVAAIASAVAKSNRQRQDRADGYRADGGYRADDDRARDDRPAAYRDAPSGRAPDPSEAYRDAPGPAEPRAATAIDAAVDACVGEVERGNRSVQSIDGVNREGEGWQVSGRVQGGYGFSCTIDKDGRVRSVEGL